jgi:RND family efflux transporter MFP subunit
VEKAKADVAGKRTEIQSRQAALDKTRLMLDFTRLTAAHDGVITRRSFHNGDYIRATEQGEQRPLFTIVNAGRMRVVAQVPETEVLLTKPGTPVDLHIAALDARIPDLKVSRIGYVTDEKTGTMRVEIDVPNDKGMLRPGMFVRANIHLGKASTNAVSVPESCIVSQERKKLVYVVRDGTAHLVAVRIGTRAEGRVEVLDGLRESDLVVTNPQNLRGDRVAVRIKDDK